jgi:subtilisin family serine protease
MKTISKTKRFIMLPARGLQAMNENNPKVVDFLVTLSGHTMSTKAVSLATHANKKTNIRVLDSVHETGAKLVELNPDNMAEFHLAYPGVRMIPEVFYRKMSIPQMRIAAKVKSGRVSIRVTLTIVSSLDNTPLSNATVVAFTDFANKSGDQGKTNSQGKVSLSLGSGNSRIQRLYVYPEKNYWPYLKKNSVISNGTSIKLLPIDLNVDDCLRHFYPTKTWQKIQNTIKVGIIDTGVGPHPDLIVAGGENTVFGENPADFHDNGDMHGTHVAGIVAAGGNLPHGLKGLALGTEIRSYRVFGVNSEGASNFSIIKAIDRAVTDGCDLINMSLGGGPEDEGTNEAIRNAYSKGTICFVAAGNENRSPVSFPAAYSLSLAVTAMGRKNTFPHGTTQADTIIKPFGTDAKNFIADFSNFGPEIDVTGPGVGIISTVPSSGYAVMDGTSMACPAATGIAARLLSTQPNLLNMTRNQQRSDEFIKFLNQNMKVMGFGGQFEGGGKIG